MIAIIGANGSMGKRYQAIFDYLKRPFACFDQEHSIEHIKTECQSAEGIIIATPTPTHGEFLRQLLPLEKKILCEKPVTKDMDELLDLDAYCTRHGYDFQMMLQYKELCDPASSGPSFYDYFRTGNDGLIWDCLQIIGLARGDLVIRNESPVWACAINGKLLSLSDMDFAYITAIQRWLEGEPNHTRREIIDMHIKTDEYAKDHYVRAD